MKPRRLHSDMMSSIDLSALSMLLGWVVASDMEKSRLVGTVAGEVERGSSKGGR